MYRHLAGFALLSLALILLTQPVTEARSLQAIQASGKLRVAVKDNLPPLGFRNSEGQLVGFEVDLAQELGRQLLGEMGKVELVPLTNPQRLEAVVQGDVDLAIAQVGITRERSRWVNFSPPYYFDGTAIAVAKDPRWQTWSDLASHSIAVLQESAAILHLNALLPEAELIPVDSYQDGVTILTEDLVVGFAADVTVLTGWVQAHPAYQVLGPLSSVGLGVAMPKGIESSDLTRQVSQTVESLRSSGWLGERIHYWGLPSNRRP
ncbi:MAG: transporter substrate-binding domain-containing protein [Synechococcaceae cyanobacterium SM2_3_1]|nr:transporter substrate-binding domain-containing protein [Synechococcaceae cyanobacterium SM2_3_1]